MEAAKAAKSIVKKVAQEAKVLIIQWINSKCLINIGLLRDEAVLDGIAHSRATMQTVGTVYPALNLKRWLLEKVSEEKPCEVGEAASIDVQRATSNLIVAQSFSICQVPVAAE